MKLSHTLFISSFVFASQISFIRAETTDKRRNEVTLQTGVLFYEGSSKVKSPGLWGIRYGRYLTDLIAVEGSLLGGREELEDGSDNANIVLPMLHGVYHLSTARLRPFVQVGLGALKTAPDNGEDSTHAATQIGGGAKWDFTPSVLGRLEAAYVYDLDSGEGQNNLLVTAGLGWRFDNPFCCTEPVKVEEVKPEPPVEVVAVKEIPKEDQFILRDVRFAFNSTKFDTKSRLHLETVAGILNNNLSLKVEIDGHTDSRGPKTYNQTLSERRADAAKKFLMEKGVAEDRIKTQGFGLTKPIASNLTVEGRSANRRVEFRVIRP